MVGLLATLVFAATVVFQAQAALPANCDRNATVAAGVQHDICQAQRLHVGHDIYQLATVDTGVIDPKCDNLYFGDDCNTTYVVQYAGTCFGIAGVHNISENTLLGNNPNLNQICTRMYPDEVLCVSSTIQVNLTQPA